MSSSPDVPGLSESFLITTGSRYFITRLDRGNDQNTTEIYMSHRAITDDQQNGKVKPGYWEVDNGISSKNKGRTRAEQERADGEDLDAELLRRLMVKLGIEDQKSHSIMANNTTQLRASINKAADGALTLAVNDEFDRAWRRVGLALDRVGFVVEDKNRSNGIYFVLFGPDRDLHQMLI